MKRVYLYLIFGMAFIIMALQGCAAPALLGYSFYKARNLNIPPDAKIGVVVYPEYPDLKNPEDIAEALGDGNPDEKFKKLFREEFIKHSKEKYQMGYLYFVDTPMDSILKEDTYFVNRKRKETYYLAKEGKPIELPGKPDYLVFIEDIILDKLIVQEDESVQTQLEGFKQINYYQDVLGFEIGDEVVLLKGKITFWDNKRGVILTYGLFDYAYPDKFTPDFDLSIEKKEIVERIRGIANYVFDSNEFKEKK